MKQIIMEGLNHSYSYNIDFPLKCFFFLSDLQVFDLEAFSLTKNFWAVEMHIHHLCNALQDLASENMLWISGGPCQAQVSTTRCLHSFSS